ncbi:unannotated protein [freshwater metagenome]|uniref:Unannotated protein n=1 Tax=freshwater metagenome TaxID=449393 RepID=A0A6J6EX36_9ZZZZ
MLLLHRESEQVELHIVFVHVGDCGEDQTSALANHAHVRLKIGALTFANGDDDLVGHASPCEFAKQRLGFSNVGCDMGCTEVLRLLTLELDWIESDDVASARKVCALHSVHANAAGADDNDGVAGCNFSCVGGGTPAGGDATSDEAGLIEGKIFFNLHKRIDVHHRMLGECAEAAHRCEVGAIEKVVTRGSIFLTTREKMRPVVAKVLLTLRA